MKSYASLGKNMTILAIFGGFFSFAFYHGPLLFGISPRTINNLTDLPDTYLFSIQAVYPYEVSTPLRYFFTEISELFGCILAFVAYTGIDVFFGTIVLHACGQLENLSNRIEVMVETANFSKYLRLHVQNHCRLIRYLLLFVLEKSTYLTNKFFFSDLSRQSSSRAV
uniref:Olfactory receptor 118 n=1 Tax=Aulacocentrum confusum TaxID=2767324 RepID=A0A7G8Z9D7_9HYME|nr:olfactory receptor 118 [Aulacocentrum confusum]